MMMMMMMMMMTMMMMIMMMMMAHRDRTKTLTFNVKSLGREGGRVGRYSTSRGVLLSKDQDCCYLFQGVANSNAWHQ